MGLLFRAILWAMLLIPCNYLRAEEKPPEAPKAEGTEPSPEAKIELQLKSSKEADQPEDLAKHIAQGIEFLEAKKFAEFLPEFVCPEEFKAILAKRGTIEEFAMHFAEKRADQMLKTLKYAQGKKVWLTEDGAAAVFDLKTSGITQAKPYLPFVKIDNKWYIKNK